MSDTQTDPTANHGGVALVSEPDRGIPKATPLRHLCIVTCMDARIDVLEAMGIKIGDAHILRNAGGLVTDDVIRSIMLSQRTLGTTDIVVLQHTDCALSNLNESEMRAEVRRDTGLEPPFIGAFANLDDSVRDGVARLRQSPLLPRRDRVSGFVFDVVTQQVRQVSDQGAPGVGL